MELQPTPAENVRHRFDELEPKIWSACVGSSVQIPKLHSRVYYFPQGHFEDAACSPWLLSAMALSKPYIHCHITDVHLLADPITDEVFARLTLLPVLPPSRSSSSSVDRFVEEDVDEDNKIDSFFKILTKSDVSGSGGFFPRLCADYIFPPLDYEATQPKQTVSISDVHGGGGYVSDNFVKWLEQMPGGVKREGEIEVEESQTNAKGSAEYVVQAAERAARGLPFEVVYYPKAGWYDFVVKAEVVEASIDAYWAPGMRVKMAMETKDSRMTWFQGTVTYAMLSDTWLWRNSSPWRMLQVSWDEPEVPQNKRSVSPWQVELVPSIPQFSINSPPAKRHKIPPDRLPTEGHEGIVFQARGFTSSPVGNLNPSMLNLNDFPAGMQGARQDLFRSFSFTNFFDETRPTDTENLFRQKKFPGSKGVSKQLTIGSPLSDVVSPGSQSSIHSSSSVTVGKTGSNSIRGGGGSFKLFGKIIQLQEPVENGLEDSGSIDDDGSNSHNLTGAPPNQVNDEDGDT